MTHKMKMNLAATCAQNVVNLRHQLAKEEAQLDELVRMIDLTGVQEAPLTHYGRCIEEEREMNGGYCGSTDLRGHKAQLRDQTSWVHSSKHDWLKAALLKQAEGGGE